MGILALVAASTPLALVVETAIRTQMMPPDFDKVRAWLSPMLTPWAWAMVPAGVVATVIGWGVRKWLVRRGLRKAKPDADPDKLRDRLALESMILASSAAQVPALGATLLFMAGAELLPVAVAMAVSTLGVFSLGIWTRDRDVPVEEREPAEA